MSLLAVACRVHGTSSQDLLNAKSTEKLRVVDDKTGPAIRGAACRRHGHTSV